MKKQLFYLAGAALLCAFALSCNKNVQTSPLTDVDEDQIVFRSKSPGFDAQVGTKATPVTSLNTGFFASATKGDSETEVWTSVSFTKSGDVFKADKWWPKDDLNYHFYASNVALTHTSSGNTVAATNATDVLCAYLPSPEYKDENTLSFEHIFARLGSVTISQTSPYTITGISLSITPKTGGTYNLKTGYGHADGTGWSSPTIGSATSIAESSPGTKSNDIYLVPGTYTLTATWTATKGEYTETFTGKQVDVALTAGKINNITASLTGNATEIELTVSITDWTSQSVPAGTFPVI